MPGWHAPVPWPWPSCRPGLPCWLAPAPGFSAQARRAANDSPREGNRLGGVEPHLRCFRIQELPTTKILVAARRGADLPGFRRVSEFPALLLRARFEPGVESRWLRQNMWVSTAWCSVSSLRSSHAWSTIVGEGWLELPTSILLGELKLHHDMFVCQFYLSGKSCT